LDPQAKTRSGNEKSGDACAVDEVDISRLVMKPRANGDIFIE
jgi:hypothetical protein